MGRDCTYCGPATGTTVMGTGSGLTVAGGATGIGAVGMGEARIAGAGVVVTAVGREVGVMEVVGAGGVGVAEAGALTTEPFAFAARAALKRCNAVGRRGLGLGRAEVEAKAGWITACVSVALATPGSA
jgi:hypothetical protein